MKDFGAVTATNWHHLFAFVLHLWVLTCIGLLLFFVSYLTALSWADLTYVLPGTAISYALMAHAKQRNALSHLCERARATSKTAKPPYLLNEAIAVASSSNTSKTV